MGRHLKFEQFNEHELINLTDEELVEYIVNARDAGRSDLMSQAIGIFSFKREKWILAKIGNKNVPKKDQAQVFMEVIASTLAVAFKGTSVGEMVNLIKRIIQFRIADYFEANKLDQGTGPRTDGEGNVFDDLEGVDTEEDIPGSELKILVDALIDAEPARTQRVIRLRIAGYPSKEVAGLITDEFPDDGEMSYMNVDQIFSRFRKQLRKLLEGDT